MAATSRINILTTRDIRISSEAPKQRLPNLSPGMKAMGHREQRLEGIVQAEAAGVHKFA